MTGKLPTRCDSPPFDDAVATFRKLLRGQGGSDNLLWIWRNSIISRRAPRPRLDCRIFVDRQALAREASIRDYYASGVARGLGIAIRGFCQADGITLCYVDLPEDAIAAEYRMICSLTCSIPVPCPIATFVDNRFVAAVLRFLIRPDDACYANVIPILPTGE